MPTRGNKNAKGEFELGYGKPPKHTQFKKGRSGNPKGRAKGAQNVKTVLVKELSEKVVISENGEKKTVTKLEAVVKSLTARGAQGDPRAALQLLNIFERVVGEEAEEGDTSKLAASDTEILDGLKARIRRDHGIEETSGDDSDEPEDSGGN